MASVTDICNLALQKLGAGKITSINQDSVAARTCLTAYEHCRDSELRDHPWRFAITRASIAEDATAPEFGKASSYELPSDFIRLLTPYPEVNFNDLDYEIEGRKIYSDLDSPLEIRYVSKVTDTSLMDSLFVEVLSCRMADQMCEALTQSNSKKQSISADYERALRKAKRTNAIESIAQDSPDDLYVTVRN